jgi:hypothetical protein
MMLRPGLPGAAQDPGVLWKTIRDLQQQIDQLRATLGGAAGSPSGLTPISGPAPTAALVRNMDGSYPAGTTVIASDFAGNSSPATITTQSF